MFQFVESAFHFNLPSVPSVNEFALESLDHSDGCFGSCSRMAYKDLYVEDGKGHSVCLGLKIRSCYSVFSQWWFYTSLHWNLFESTCHRYVLHQCS